MDCTVAEMYYVAGANPPQAENPANRILSIKGKREKT